MCYGVAPFLVIYEEDGFLKQVKRAVEPLSDFDVKKVAQADIETPRPFFYVQVLMRSLPGTPHIPHAHLRGIFYR